MDLARSAAQELAGPGRVGQYLGVEADGDRIVTHLFECLDPAYVGWRWAVTVDPRFTGQDRNGQREPAAARP